MSTTNQENSTKVDNEKGETLTNSSQKKVIVAKYGATWCGPCRRSEPFYEQVKKVYQDLPVDFYSVDIDNPSGEIPEFVTDLIDEITSVPYVVIFGTTEKSEPVRISGWKEADVRLAIETALPKKESKKNEYFIRPGTVLSSSEEEGLEKFVEGDSFGSGDDSSDDESTREISKK